MKPIDLTRFIWRTAGIIGIATLLPAQSILAQANVQDSLTWSGFLSSWLEQDDQGRGEQGGGRIPDFCAVTNYATPVQVWHLQPVYLWQGTDRPISIRPGGEPENPLPTGITVDSEMDLNLAQSIDTQLQPGGSYAWVVYDRLDQEQPIIVEPFRVMAATEREQVTAALEQLVQDLNNQGASAEAIALARADYFLGQGLIVDAVQSMFLVEAPSADLLANRTEMVESLCYSETLDEE